VTDSMDEYWMLEGLKEAERGLAEGELPIASVLVAGGLEIGRAHSRQVQSKSITAHGEWLVLHEAKELVWTAARPLVLYTTLESCVMCLGAAMLTSIDRIVFGMRAIPNGSTRYIGAILAGGQRTPVVDGGVLEAEEVVLMRRFLIANPSFPRLPFVRALLAAYDEVPIAERDSGVLPTPRVE
jgi:tRNA(Arg) A34 adenosine deaminase TadA